MKDKLPIKILDIIYYRESYYIIIDRAPVFVYERKGDKLLIAEDSGFFNFLKYSNPSGNFYAFGGHKFDIPMTNGTTKEAYGQWWDTVPRDYSGLLYSVGYSTIEELNNHNVFCGGNIDQLVIDQWLNEDLPSNNYNKYNPQHVDFGVHVK